MSRIVMNSKQCFYLGHSGLGIDMRQMRINKSKRCVAKIDRALERRTLDAERANAGTLGKQMMATVNNRLPAEQQIAKPYLVAFLLRGKIELGQGKSRYPE